MITTRIQVLLNNTGKLLHRFYCSDKPGNLSFILNMFKGKLELREVFPFPHPLTEDLTKIVKTLITPITSFLNKTNDAAKNDQNEGISDKDFERFWQLGLCSLQIPQDFGGLGLNNTQYARIVQIVGQNDLGVGVILGAHQAIGFKGILLFGTKKQKEKYLPMVGADKLAAFCLTEADSGSDLTTIKTSATLTADGLHYVLNGSKFWVTNGASAQIFTVFAQIKMTDPKTNQIRNKVTAFIVERAFAGVTSGPCIKKMGIRASETTEVFFNQVHVPIENVLGGVGNGFKVAMHVVNNGRFGMVSALAGTMRTCIKKAAEFAETRIQFGNKINHFQTIQEKIARMAMLQYATESMAFMLAGNMDNRSESYYIEAAIAKCFASEAAWYVCDEAIQIHGGVGYLKDTGLERIMRDLRVFRIFEGTNDILRLFVVHTGLRYSGRNMKELQEAFKDPASNLGLIFRSHGHRKLPELVPGLDFTHLVHKDLADSAKLVSHNVLYFHEQVQFMLGKYGKDVVHEQFLLNKLADAAIMIYACVVVLSRCTLNLREKLPTAEYEKLLVKCLCQEGYERAKYNLDTMSNPNYNEVFSAYGKIAKGVCSSQGAVQRCPLGL